MERFFKARSVALVGLSENPLNIPGIILDNLIAWQYPGTIYGVNPKGGSVRGVTIYPSLSALPGKPDLISIMTPAARVPGIVEEAGRLGITRAVIPTGGFSEFDDSAGSPGRLLKEAAGRYGVRFVGPNGLTVIDAHSRLCLPFFPIQPIRPGGVSIMSQSGGVGLTLLTMLDNENLGLAKFISLGNKASLDECDFLEYLIGDPETEIICCYLESIQRGRRFAELAARSPKPVFVYKANTSRSAHAAAMSHTAAVANDEQVLQAALSQSGVVQVDRLEKLMLLPKAFHLPRLAGERFVAISPAGGFAVIAADMCDRFKLPLVDLDPEMLKQMEEFGNAGVIRLSNPLDLGDVYNPLLVAQVVDMVMRSPTVDGAIFIALRPGGLEQRGSIFQALINADLTPMVEQVLTETRKPLAIALHSPAIALGKIKHHVRFPLFDSPEEVCEAMAVYRDHCLGRRVQDVQPLPEPEPPAGPVADPIGFLAARGVPFAPWLTTADPDEAARFAATLDGPAVVKTAAPGVVHKSEAGGVMSGLDSPAAVRTAAAGMIARLGPPVVVQRMERGVAEAFVGARRDPAFGPVVAAGSGGILVELHRDVAMRLAPVTEATARGMLADTTLARRIAGFRNLPPGDLDRLVALIVHVSHLFAAIPDLAELDLNPVIVRKAGEGVVAVDARLRTGIPDPGSA